jgi:hypothetical protein
MTKAQLAAKPKEESQQSHQRRKSVSFSNLEIRNYEQVIGDHPCCKIGCPLSLGWDYSESSCVSLDQYEESRAPRRPRGELLTTCEERRDILLHGVDALTLKRAERKLHRARSCEAKLCERINHCFFESSPSDE